MIKSNSAFENWFQSVMKRSQAASWSRKWSRDHGECHLLTCFPWFAQGWYTVSWALPYQSSVKKKKVPSLPLGQSDDIFSVVSQLGFFLLRGPCLVSSCQKSNQHTFFFKLYHYYWVGGSACVEFGGVGFSPFTEFWGPNVGCRLVSPLPAEPFRLFLSILPLGSVFWSPCWP